MSFLPRLYTHADVFDQINQELAAASPEQRRQLEELERSREELMASYEQDDEESA